MTDYIHWSYQVILYFQKTGFKCQQVFLWTGKTEMAFNHTLSTLTLIGKEICLKHRKNFRPLRIQNVAVSWVIGHFWVTLCLCFKASSFAKPLIWKWLWFSWNWSCRGNTFPYEWFGMENRFDAETKDNSEMDYYGICKLYWLTTDKQ